jgi:hypothetical protein
MLKRQNSKQSDDKANWLWLHQWAGSVDRKLNLILFSIKQIKENGSISPELEAEINKSLVGINVIDQKVPDQKEG